MASVDSRLLHVWYIIGSVDSTCRPHGITPMIAPDLGRQKETICEFENRNLKNKRKLNQYSLLLYNKCCHVFVYYLVVGSFAQSHLFFIKFQIHWYFGSEEKIFFTIYRRGGHLGHVTQIPRTTFCSLYPWRLHVQFDFDWPSEMFEDGEQVDDKGPMCL